MNQNVSDRERYVQEQFNKWSEHYIIPFEHEFELRKYFELQHQYDNTPDDHVKTKRELIDMMGKLKYHLPRLKPKLNNELYDKLLKAAVKRQLVNVYPIDRGTGKTTTLIKFAKEFGFAVIVHSQEIANILIDHHGYDHIYGYGEDGSRLRGYKFNQVVLDEVFEPMNITQILNNMKNMGWEVITGYITK